MRKTKSISIVLLSSLLLLASGCGSSGQSASAIRDAFVKSGGVCSSSDGPATTTTVSRKVPTYPIVERIDCGEEEASITVYKSEDDAKKAEYFSNSLVDAVGVSFGSEEIEFYGIFVGSAFIYLPRDSYTESEAQQIADKLGGTFHSSFDLDFQNRVFEEIASKSANGGMTEAADGCVSSELLSNDAISISFDTKGEEDSNGDAIYLAFCVLKALSAPDYIIDSVMQTRSLDGRIEESWGAFRASWTYNPNSGMNMTILFEG